MAKYEGVPSLYDIRAVIQCLICSLFVLVTLVKYEGVPSLYDIRAVIKCLICSLFVLVTLVELTCITLFVPLTPHIRAKCIFSRTPITNRPMA